MLFARFLLKLTVLLLTIAIVGCAGSGFGPATPASIPPESGLTGSGHAPESPTGSREGYRLIWGYYDVAIDIASGRIDIVPLRSPEYVFNVTSFLQPPAGNPANLGLAVIDATQFQSNGRIVLDISLTHPFPGSTRLRGFDVMGVFMGNGTVYGYHDPSAAYPASDGSEAILLNADGYTRWMNATEFTQSGLLGFTPGSKGIPGFSPSSTINGYKYYSEFLNATDDLAVFFQTPGNVAARGSFPAGATLTRRFDIQFPISGGKPFVRFQYAVLASFAPAPPGIPNPSVTDFPVAANLQEPIHIAGSDNGSTLYYVSPTDLGGSLKVQLEVFDWQGAADPAGVPGELSHLWIEDSQGAVIPGGAIDVLPTATVSAGCGNSSVFSVDIPGCTPLATGQQEFLITAESASPNNYDNGFGAPFPASAPLAAFARFSVNVANYNPCPTPVLDASNNQVFDVNDIVSDAPIYGTDFENGPDLAVELQRSTGNVASTDVDWVSVTTVIADFDFTNVTAGMYDIYFMNGCGIPAQTLSAAFEVNTPPTSTGITGPTTGDGTLGSVSYNANATDSDTDPVDTLTYTWDVSDLFTSTKIVGPASGDPLTFNYAVLPVSQYDVQCIVSDGYAPAQLNLHYTITRTNTQPTIGTPSGPTPVWINQTLTYSVSASDVDPGQVLTYLWSLVPKGNSPNYSMPGDPTPGQLTINFKSAVGTQGAYTLSCRVDDGSGAPNALALSPGFDIYVSNLPYSGAIPPGCLSQVIKPGLPSSQGVAGCPSFWDSFYNPLFTIQLAHPDISVQSGPSTGKPGSMVIADELGAITGPFPPPPPMLMGFAHYTCPFSSGNPPAWIWLTMGLFPNGPDMVPSVIHFDGNANGEMFLTNSQMTNKLAGFGVNDPSAFQHCMAGGPLMNDLFTTMGAAGTPDVAVDCTAGFDLGSPVTPMTAPLYGLYTQDMSWILNSCGGMISGQIAPFPVSIMQFPSMGVQPPGIPVNLGGSVAVVAPMPQLMVGPGPGLFNVFPGGPCPAGVMVFPEPYYALAIDDNPANNLFTSNLPQPVSKWVVAATIDSDRDLEIYEIDFGVPPPVPAAMAYLGTVPMGSFMNGNANAFPLDCAFIPNFSSFGGTSKPVWPEDLLAVLTTDTKAGVWSVDIYSLASGSPVLVTITMPVPVPPAMFLKPGIAYRLDVDEVTGDIYVIHDDAAGTASMAVTIIPY